MIKTTKLILGGALMLIIIILCGALGASFQKRCTQVKYNSDMPLKCFLKQNESSRDNLCYSCSIIKERSSQGAWNTYNNDVCSWCIRKGIIKGLPNHD
jgi:hypothetical protein